LYTQCTTVARLVYTMWRTGMCSVELVDELALCTEHTKEFSVFTEHIKTYALYALKIKEATIQLSFVKSIERHLVFI